MKHNDIGFQEAFDRAMAHIPRPAVETLSILHAQGRVCAEKIHARVDSPSVDASLKDGYAVKSSDLTDAALSSPVRLRVIGHAAAGVDSDHPIQHGETVRILSGAKIPEGADAVLAEEFTDVDGDTILARADAEKGRNIMPKGTDVSLGMEMADEGDVLTPALIGFLVAGGLATLPVFKKPRVGLLATGSEVLLPGKPLPEGKLYASNAALQYAWLTSKGFDTLLDRAGDTFDAITEKLAALLETTDVVITSGGAWKGERDLIVKVLAGLGGHQIFHRARMGPGKAVGLAIVNNKPVFSLPGGPTSNEMAFLMIAFPGILKMAGHRYFPYPRLEGVLTATVRGQADWTQFLECRVEKKNSRFLLTPQKLKSRLASMFKTQALIQIPEGRDRIPEGESVPFWCMDNRILSVRI